PTERHDARQRPPAFQGHPLTRCTSPPCDRCRDDPTLVCVTRKPSGEAARPHGNCWLLRGEDPFLPATRPGCPGRRDRHHYVPVSHFSQELDKHVVSRPPCASGVSWTLLHDQDPAPQGGRTCSLHPPSVRSYSGSGPPSPRRPSPPSSTSPPAGASRTGAATS